MRHSGVCYPLGVTHRRAILSRWQKGLVGVCVCVACVPVVFRVASEGRDVAYVSVGANPVNVAGGRVVQFEMGRGTFCEWMIVPWGRTLRVKGETAVGVVGWVAIAGYVGIVVLGSVAVLLVKDAVFVLFEKEREARKEARRVAEVSRRFDVIPVVGGGRSGEVEEAEGGGRDGG